MLLADHISRSRDDDCNIMTRRRVLNNELGFHVPDRVLCILPIFRRRRVWRPLLVTEDMFRPVKDEIIPSIGNRIAMLAHQILERPGNVSPPQVERRARHLIENIDRVLLRWNTISADQLANKRINIVAACATNLTTH